MRYMLTGELWAAMEPLVRQAKTHRGGQPPVIPDRLFFEALLYLGRTGVPLRDLPGEFGEVRRVLIDSTAIRAHRHAAGVRRKKKRSGPAGARRRGASAGAGAG